jgi:hypothetical protein
LPGGTASSPLPLAWIASSAAGSTKPWAATRHFLQTALFLLGIIHMKSSGLPENEFTACGSVWTSSSHSRPAWSSRPSTYTTSD